MHPIEHARASAAKFGGRPEDYVQIHAWFDESKAFIADFREAEAFAQLGRVGFDETIDSTFDEVITDLMRGGLDGNYDGGVVLDVASGTYQAKWETS